MKEKEASVTVFLALIFLILFVFVCTILESVRIRTAKVYYQMALASSVESAEAGYCRELFDEYGLLLYWQKGETLAEDISDFFASYEDPGKGLMSGGVTLYQIKEGGTESENLLFACDDGYRALRKQMTDAIFYDGAEELVTGITDLLTQITKGDSLREEVEDFGKNFDETDWYEAYMAEIAESGTYKTEEEEESEDEETEGICSEEEWEEQIEESLKSSFVSDLLSWIRHPFLSMVLPDSSDISDGVIDMAGASVGEYDNGEYEPVVSSRYLEKALIGEYILLNANCYTDDDAGTGIQYETEYILTGKSSDEENLSSVVNKLLLIREGMNLIYLITDSESNHQAAALAELLLGWTMLPFLVEGLKYVILSAWSYAESIVDLRILLAGEKVPLVKNSSSWEVTIERIPLLIIGKEWKEQDHDEGMSYEDYLRLLLFTDSLSDIVPRMASVIQLHMKEYNSSFWLRDCISEADITFNGTLSSGFLWFPVESATGNSFRNISLKQHFSYESD